MSLTATAAPDSDYLDGVVAGLKLALRAADDAPNVVLARMALGGALQAAQRLEPGDDDPLSTIRRSIAGDNSRVFRRTR